MASENVLLSIYWLNDDSSDFWELSVLIIKTTLF